uniref:CCHC-type domain-containing protein n=1 Tax=Labrus bergylta TaxID=56723 RepID=A0A3Q3GKU4_9LABR
MQSESQTLQYDPGALRGDQGPREDLATGGDSGGPRGHEQGGLDQLYALIQRHMQVQEREAFKQEQRWRSIQIQLNQVRDEMEAEKREEVSGGMEHNDPERRGALSRSPATGGSPPPDNNPPFPVGPATWSRATIPKLEEGDDIEPYLTTFERLATAYRWPRAEWAVQLVPHLTGKARSAYVAMDVNDSVDYDKVKEAILAKYEINEEMYRQRFRDPETHPGETPRELYHRLKELYKKWVKPAQKTMEEVGEVLILEQFLRTLSPEVRVWVMEHNPENGQRAAQLVEAFMAARRGPKFFRHVKNNRPTTPKGKSGGFGGGGQHFSDERRGVGVKFPDSTAGKRNKDPPVCYFCGKEGHIKPECPALKVKGANTMCCVPRPTIQKADDHEVRGKMQIATVTVNGMPATALLDSASTQTLVMPYLVQQQQMGEGEVEVWCVHGDKRPYPTACVYLEVQGQSYLLEVGVVPGLSHPVLLGQDLPILPRLLHQSRPVNMVVTRARRDNTSQSLQPITHSQGLEQLPFSQVEFPSESNGRVNKSRQQRRREKLMGALRQQQQPVSEPEQSAGDSWWEVPGDLNQLQREDNTLQTAFSKVTEIDGVSTGVSPSLTGESFLMRKGLHQHSGT